MPISTAVDNSAVARVLGIKTEFSNLRRGGVFFLPQRVAVIGQGATLASFDTTKRQVTTSSEVGQTYGFGSPVHLATRALLPNNGDGVGSIPVTIYPLEDDGSGIAAAGDITPSGTALTTANYVVLINNIRSSAFTVLAGASIADITAAATIAINSNLDMPVIAADGATQIDITAKWAGASGNDIHAAIEPQADGGTTWGISQPSGGLTNPDIQPALDQIGTVWETMLLNCMDIADTVTLDLLLTFLDGRWGALQRKPGIAFTGNTIADVNSAVAVSDARAADRANCQLVSPGSADLPLVVAARQLARIVKVANDIPPHDYGAQAATGLKPGTDGQQWQFPARDLAVKAGSSTVEIRDGVVNLSDTVTFYHPTGEQTPAYRYVCDIVKLQQVIFNLDLIFASPEWNGAPLIPDGQPTREATAKQPKSAVSAVASLLDNLALDAIIVNPELAKKNTFASIDEQNPKRLNLSTTVQLSGNTNIISVDLNFGFYFGSAQVIG